MILPGVGAFGDAMEKLNQYGLTEVVREVAQAGIPLIGICLGMQLLFERSDESDGVPRYRRAGGRYHKDSRYAGA